MVSYFKGGMQAKGISKQDPEASIVRAIKSRKLAGHVARIR